MKERMIKRIAGSAAALALVAGLAACGEERAIPPASTTISGVAAGSKIISASVFLDINGDGVKQATEPGTTSSSTAGSEGSYSFTMTGAQVADYLAHKAAAKLTVKDGTDATTGLKIGLLIADPPAGIDGSGTAKSDANVTPLTTLAASLPTQAEKDTLTTKLKSLGLAKIDDTFENTTPAIIALVKSIETVLTTSQKAVEGDGSNANLVTAALKVAQEAAKQVATALKDTADIKTTVTNTATLATTLATAVQAAITKVDNDTTVTLAVNNLANIVSSIQSATQAVAEAIKTQVESTGGSLASTTNVKESAVITAVAQAISTKINETIDSTNGFIQAPADTTAPTVNITATGNLTDVVLTLPSIKAVFSEDVAGVSASTFTLKSAAGASVSGTVTYSSTTRTATFTPTAKLAAGTTFTATISKAITDKAGNPLAADVKLTFTTTTATGATGGTAGGTGLNF
ncbi:MAG: Ig-like domain-containing protein [Deltaproteobacteria bacterium]|nr:Ig-like domain-containing protein [Deltaproteobacteria bacterium]